MKTGNYQTVAELFTDLINDHGLATNNLNPQLILQLQGQMEESLGLLNDVVDELRTIAPESIPALKSLTLQIFENDLKPE
ncbi:MAG: hypothetical protein AAFN00_12765 [Cyanobacteria bacterium J06558_2]